MNSCLNMDGALIVDTFWVKNTLWTDEPVLDGLSMIECVSTTANPERTDFN